jgi:hypothetical protein
VGRVRGLSLVAATFALAGACAPRTLALREAAPATRWVLACAGRSQANRVAYTVDDFVRLLAVVDANGRPAARLATGVLFLHLYEASGRTFTTWIGGRFADGADEEVYLDSLLGPGGVDRLVAAATRVAADLGSRGPLPVALMIPYPEPRVGTLRLAGETFDLTSDPGRVAAAARFVDVAAQRFRARGTGPLRLDAFYWLLESAPASDTAVIAATSRPVHAAGYRFLWIPYYTAERWDRWRELGFDEAWLQPNHCFDPSVPDTRLDSAAARALAAGMGLELEFDRRMYRDSCYAGRPAPYLETLGARAELRGRSVVLYEEDEALVDLSRRAYADDSVAAARRRLHARLAEVLR